MPLTGIRTKAHIIEVLVQNIGSPEKKAPRPSKLLKLIKSTQENGESVLISSFDNLCIKKKVTEWQKPGDRQMPDK